MVRRHGNLLSVLEITPETLWFRQSTGGYVCDSASLERVMELPQVKVVHGVGDPVGGSVRVDPARLSLFVETLGRIAPEVVSEHLSFTRSGPRGNEHFAGFMLPPRQTAAGVHAAVGSIRALAEHLAYPFAVENGVSYLRPRSDEMTDGEFVAAVVDEADVGIVLDLHNLYANERNGRQSMEEFINCIPLDRVWEIHVAGGLELDGYWLDAHSGAVPEPVWTIAAALVPSLANLSVINFELVPEFFGEFGEDRVIEQLERCQVLWSMRGTATRVERPSSPPAVARQTAGPTVSEWEEQLSSLIGSGGAGCAASPMPDDQLVDDPGVGIYRLLIEEFRAGMIARALRLSTRLLLLQLGEVGVRRLLSEFWAETESHPFASDEAEAFTRYVRRTQPPVPHLMEVLNFEVAILRAFTDGSEEAIEFAGDPVCILDSLARGVLPPAPTSERTLINVGFA